MIAKHISKMSNKDRSYEKRTR